jgi:N-carbamoyl-L-amino-acid hydrolase
VNQEDREVPVKLDHARLLADLRRLAGFGRLGTGVDRPAFSPEDRAAREWLLERMMEAGLDARIDGVGNVYGRMPGVVRAVLVGSHTDTVPKGGWLDGALGVLYGLEIARAWIGAGGPTAVGIDVISFADEESTYSGMLGSRSFCAGPLEGELDTAKNAEGRSLGDALAELGWAGRSLARLDLARHVAYLEAHIEQGLRLEAEAQRIGIVTGIVAIRRIRVQFTGRSDHAGTTPMHLRKDAGAALIEFCHDLQRRLQKVRATDTVWNLGHIAFAPGVANVVPGSAEVLIEYRDASAAVLDRIETEIQAAITVAEGRAGVTAAASPLLALAAAEMDPDTVELIERAARGRDVPAIRMPSGAGHDAMVLSRHLPTGMLFIPSIGGRSHDVAEDSHEADILLGADVLADAALAVAGRGGELTG